MELESVWPVEVEDEAASMQTEANVVHEPGAVRIYLGDEAEDRPLLFEAKETSSFLSIFPKNSMGRAAYGRIHEIRIDLECMDEWDPADPVAYSGFGRLDEVRRLYVKGLPEGLGRVPDFGLTLPPQQRRIVHAIEDGSPATVLHICKVLDPYCPPDTFQITGEEWASLVAGFRITAGRGQAVASRVNDHAAESLVRGRLGLPSRELSLGRLDVIKRMTPIVAGETEIDDILAASLLDSMSGEATAVAKLSPKKFARLNAQMDLVSLDVLIELFANRLDEDLKEKDWQKFFEENRFALQQIFSSPLALVSREAMTRFPGINGQGGQFTDFLLANTVTKTAHLVEIKTPKTKLFDKEYRGKNRAAVFPPHRDLAGGVAQLQAQVASAKETLIPALIQDGGNPNDLNTTVIYGAIIAGSLSGASEAQKESFLRYRWGLSNVLILTYDEVLQRLRDLRVFLSPVGS